LVPARDAPAQTYPARPIRLIVPFSAGGTADIPARALAQRLSDALGQQVFIDNRPGAGSTIGAEAAAKAPPDGHTLFLISNTHFVSAALYKNLPYDPLNDFSPVNQFVVQVNVLVTHPSFAARSVAELIALARANPGKIDFASSGNGSTQHLTATLFSSMAGISMNHVPYRGSGPATADLLAGIVKVGFPGTSGMMAHIKAGKLRALGVTGIKRSAELPDVPTIAEAGLAGFEMVSWSGIAGPKGLSREIRLRLDTAMRDSVAHADFQKHMVATGNEVAMLASPEKFFDFMRAEAAKFARVVRESGAQVN
jgi:tripartite-type tricarboxylate transporter receptor subunit TctC